MAAVIHNGKKYHFSVPYNTAEYLITRYGPYPDQDGITNPNDLMLLLHDKASDENIWADEEDALELEENIRSVEFGSLSIDQFQAKLTAIFKFDQQ
jgi:hypothetical protein